MRTRMYGGVTGKAGDGLPMSILPRTFDVGPPWAGKIQGGVEGIYAYETPSGEMANTGSAQRHSTDRRRYGDFQPG